MTRMERLQQIADDAKDLCEETTDRTTVRLCLLIAKLAMELAKAAPEE